ncbi:MAG: cytidylate kinase [Legionellales bacterium RIFCSPHIGHO2_12_FULL_37_14]|nr:MAG: cytidylate kinase [Legionellales bacterium RIFCSPHIGHO2_12_FULL_37_14]
MSVKIPVITIDGPSGTGKGTIAAMLADYLSWHRLDSGAIYRLLAYRLEQQHIDFNAEKKVIQEAKNLPVRFGLQREIWLDNHNVSHQIREEHIGQLASQLGALPYVRKALLKRQRDFRQSPGLVTDGRDMGTVVFPDATLKFYLTASAEVRSQRRYAQLKAQGICVNLAQVFSELESRDARDTSRKVSPLTPASDAILIDTTTHSIVEVFNLVMHDLRKVLKNGN